MIFSLTALKLVEIFYIILSNFFKVFFYFEKKVCNHANATCNFYISGENFGLRLWMFPIPRLCVAIVETTPGFPENKDYPIGSVFIFPVWVIKIQ